MKRLAIALTGLLLLTGCKLRIDLNTKINPDESGRISFAVAMDEEFREALANLGTGFGEAEGTDPDAGDPFADLENQVPEGWESERFTDGEFQGVRISRNFTDLDDLQAAIRETEELNESGDAAGTETPASFEEFKVTHEGDIFTLEMGASTTSFSETSGEGVEGAEGSADDQFAEAFAELEIQAIVIVTMPGKVTDHNAHDKDGSTLTWRFDQDSGSQRLRAVSDASQSAGDGGGFPVALVAGGGAAAALAVGGFLVARRKKKPHASYVPPMYPGVPGAGPQPAAPPPPPPPAPPG